jgi:hypothetical protein
LLVTEWNGYIIPFTKGCSFYIGSENGEVLLIRSLSLSLSFCTMKQSGFIVLFQKAKFATGH